MLQIFVCLFFASGERDSLPSSPYNVALTQGTCDRCMSQICLVTFSLGYLQVKSRCTPSNSAASAERVPRFLEELTQIDLNEAFRRRVLRTRTIFFPSYKKVTPPAHTVHFLCTKPSAGRITIWLLAIAAPCLVKYEWCGCCSQSPYLNYQPLKGIFKKKSQTSTYTIISYIGDIFKETASSRATIWIVHISYCRDDTNSVEA